MSLSLGEILDQALQNKKTEKKFSLQAKQFAKAIRNIAMEKPHEAFTSFQDLPTPIGQEVLEYLLFADRAKVTPAKRCILVRDRTEPNTIYAIKSLRQATGLGLLAAKDIIDKLNFRMQHFYEFPPGTLDSNPYLFSTFSGSGFTVITL